MNRLNWTELKASIADLNRNLGGISSSGKFKMFTNKYSCLLVDNGFSYHANEVLKSYGK